MPKLNAEKWSKNRDEIVAVAFGLFAQKGYSRVSVNEIIKEAQISKGCFYTYFQSKQEVFFAIVENSDMNKATLSEKIDLSLSPVERIGEYIRVRLRNFLEESNRQWVKFASEFWATAEFTEDMTALNQKRYKAFEQDIKNILIAGMDSGHFKKDISLDAFAYVLIALINGVANLAGVMQFKLDEEKINMAIDIITTYLKEEQL